MTTHDTTTRPVVIMVPLGRNYHDLEVTLGKVISMSVEPENTLYDAFTLGTWEQMNEKRAVVQIKTVLGVRDMHSAIGRLKPVQFIFYQVNSPLERIMLENQMNRGSADVLHIMWNGRILKTYKVDGILGPKQTLRDTIRTFLEGTDIGLTQEDIREILDPLYEYPVTVARSTLRADYDLSSAFVPPAAYIMSQTTDEAFVTEKDILAEACESM